MDLDAVRVPDSALAKAAESYVSALSSGSLVNHLYRTYYWGTLLAQADKVRIKDEELFYVAALLHDLGLTKQHRCTDSNVVDFSVDGGFARSARLSTFARSSERSWWRRSRRDRIRGWLFPCRLPRN